MELEIEIRSMHLQVKYDEELFTLEKQGKVISEKEASNYAKKIKTVEFCGDSFGGTLPAEFFGNDVELGDKFKVSFEKVK